LILDSVSGELDRQIELVSLLEDPMRRALYRHVAHQPDYVGRDAAAAAVGVSRGLAAFHLDKLADEGLLEVTFRRPAGRSGPGAGRPSKLYRRARAQVAVSLPPRDYELLAGLLAGALDGPLSEGQAAALAGGARRAGAAIAMRARRLGRDRPALDAGLDALRDRGFEPDRTGPAIRLRNCPFQAVARVHVDLVCPLNLALLEGFAGTLGVAGLDARLEPQAGFCCVALHLDG
jgi:predicted ArsR family transcriptional regulator